jgi:hypothetical protein
VHLLQPIGDRIVYGDCEDTPPDQETLKDPDERTRQRRSRL